MSDNSSNYACSNAEVLQNLIKLAVAHVSSVEVFSEDKYQAALRSSRRLAGATGGNTVPLHPLKAEAPRG